MVTFMDEVVGNATAALKARNMWGRTLLWFTSDNGGPSFDGSHHLAASNFPLRATKASGWEGGYRAAAARGSAAASWRAPRRAWPAAGWAAPCTSPTTTPPCALCALAGADAHGAPPVD